MDASADFMLKGKKIVSMKSICPVMKTFVLAALTLQNIFLNRILNCSMQNKVYFFAISDILCLYVLKLFNSYKGREANCSVYNIALAREQLLIILGK